MRGGRPQYSPYSLDKRRNTGRSQNQHPQKLMKTNQTFSSNSVQTYNYNPLKNIPTSNNTFNPPHSNSKNDQNSRVGRDQRQRFNSSNTKAYSMDRTNSNLQYAQSIQNQNTMRPPKKNPLDSQNYLTGSHHYRSNQPKYPASHRKQPGHNPGNSYNSTKNLELQSRSRNGSQRPNRPEYSMNHAVSQNNPLNSVNNMNPTNFDIHPSQSYNVSGTNSHNMGIGRRRRAVSPINKENRGSLSITKSMNDQYKRLNYGHLSTGLSSNNVNNTHQSRGVGNPLNSNNSNGSYRGNFQPRNNLNNGRSHGRRNKNLDREKERMRKLGTQKQALEQIFNKKYVQFKEHINKNLKEKFDAELKRALFHLWKHYKNCQENPNKEACKKQLKDNMQKIYNESSKSRTKSDHLKAEVMHREKATANVINRAIKEGTMISKNISAKKMRNLDPRSIEERKKWLESQMTILNKDNTILQQKISEIEQSRNERVYDIKLKMEKEGRDEMEEKSRELLLMSVNASEPEIGHLKREVANLKVSYEQMRADWINSGCGPNPGEMRIRDLEGELYDLQKKTGTSSSENKRRESHEFY